MIRYALGMDLALPDPAADEPGGWTRESLLAGVVRQVALIDDYELRLVLRFDVSVDCPHDVTEGEMVFMVAEGTGGPIDESRARPIIDEADTLGRSGELPDLLAPLLIGPALGAKRTLILPPHCGAQVSAAPADHPLHRVAYVPAVEVKGLLATISALDEVAHLAKLVDFCIRSRVVLSVTTEA
jgi:hypothetical protein